MLCEAELCMWLLSTHLCSVNEGDALINNGLVGCEIVFTLIVSPVALSAQQTLHTS